MKRDWWSTKFFNQRGQQKEVGLYIYGGVGTGKSMLMDIFYDEVSSSKKSRTHFNSFMQDVHERLNEARLDGVENPIIKVAKEICKDVSVLCFDEFQISDISDAMIVGRLFSQLISKGIFIVTTSNRHPNSLYEDGLNRHLFLPFINLLETRLQVIELNAKSDYRRKKLTGHQIYFSPINTGTRKNFNMIWESLILERPKPIEFHVKGRSFILNQHSNGVGRSSFYDLCGSALGALDYHVLCEKIKVLFIEDIPSIDSTGMDSAKRFVTLIDTLYENNIRIVCLAEKQPEFLYPIGKGSFEFERTVSRLYEMQSEDWISGIGSTN